MVAVWASNNVGGCCGDEYIRGTNVRGTNSGTNNAAANNGMVVEQVLINRIDQLEKTIKRLEIKTAEQEANLEGLHIMLYDRVHLHEEPKRHLQGNSDRNLVSSPCNMEYDSANDICIIQHNVRTTGNLETESGLNVTNDAEFNGNVSFVSGANFGGGIEATFNTPVTFFHDVTIQGPINTNSKSKSSDDTIEGVNFIVKDKVHIGFEQDDTFVVKSESKFKQDVDIALDSDDPSSEDEPQLYVGGDVWVGGTINGN